MKDRIVYLDIIRVFACVMIIAMHAPIPNTGLSCYVLSADSLLTAPGIGLFIMVSGALVLPIRIPTKAFLKKRFGKIAIPTIFWTFFYMLDYCQKRGTDGIDFLRVLITIPFSFQFCLAFWFMYMLAGLYLLAPILSSWLKQVSKKELEFYLSLWAITMCYPFIRDYIGINESYNGILYYFGGYAGYFLLGYYLRIYVNEWPVWKSLLLMFIPLSIATLFKVLEVQVRFYDMFWYLSAFVVMMSISWFMMAKRVNVDFDNSSRLHHGLAFVSNCCFGIYLVHMFVMRSIIWNWMWLYDIGPMQILVVTILTFIGSFLITWLISYLPGAEFIIGFKQKK